MVKWLVLFGWGRLRFSKKVVTVIRWLLGLPRADAESPLFFNLAPALHYQRQAWDVMSSLHRRLERLRHLALLGPSRRHRRTDRSVRSSSAHSRALSAVISLYCATETLTTCPAPGGAPKPIFETYRFPSGPIVMPVGTERPLATVSTDPLGSTRTILPFPGAGKPGAALDSNTYMRSLESNTRPSTVVAPVASMWTCPAGLIFRILALPTSIGKVFRLPT